MTNIIQGTDSIQLYAGGACLLRHDSFRPFASAVYRQKVYKSSRGIHKSLQRELERIELRSLSFQGRTLCFSGGGHALTVKLREEPLGWRLEFQGEPGWSYEFSLPSYPGEAVFGGGEQYRQLNLKKQRVSNFVSEHIKAATVAEKALLPAALYREKEHGSIGSYAPMPIFVTGEKRLIFFSTSADGWADFGEREYRFCFDSCPDSLLLLKADSFSTLSSALAREIPNRQYLPDWCLDGMILGIQGGTERVLSKAFAMQDAGARICGVWVQDWCGELRTVMGKQVWWNWEVDPALYPELKAAIARLNRRGIKFLGYINPYLVKDGPIYRYCRDRAWLIRRRDGQVYHIKSTTFEAGMLDLTNPLAADYLKQVLIGKNMLSLGMSGYMADFGEYLPPDCVLYEGDPRQMHNRWPVLWARLNREAIQEFGRGDEMFFTRSGYTGIQSYAPIMWNGDQHTDYTKDYGMPCVIPASLSLGFSGVTLVHSDTGGFFSFGKLRRDEELFIRWMEMCCFSPLLRSHESIRPWANTQFDSPKVMEHTVRLSRIHAALAPYLKQCCAQAASGLPAMRPDFWPQDDYNCHKEDYAYFLGDELFVSPVIQSGQRQSCIQLPPGNWVHLWSEGEYAGGFGCCVKAPLGQIPVFYKKDGQWSALFKALKNCGEVSLK